MRYRMGSDAPRVAVLIPAAGTGSRLGQGRNKLLVPLAGVPVVVRTLRAFQAHPRVAAIGVVLREADRAALEAALPPGAARAKLLPWIAGGAERQDSVYNGLQALAGAPPDWVLVHDGARPLCTAALIDRVLDALHSAPAAVPVLPVTDTVRRIAEGRSEVVERTGLFRTQTPQGFHWDALWEAHQGARAQGWRGTDDAQLLEARGASVAFVDGEADNLKITTAADLAQAEWRLARWAADTGAQDPP